MKPFLNYIGSKRKIMKELKFPEKINNYYEPFIGGGSVYFHINNNYNIKKNYINDLNKDVINIYKCIKKNNLFLIKELDKIELKNTKSQFKEIINKFNNLKLNNYMKCVYFLFLNKRSFNCDMRYDNKNKIINPRYSKKYNKIKIYNKHNLFLIEKLLKKTSISNFDYLKFLEKYKPKKGDFVFLDPPYKVKYVNNYYKFNFDNIDYENLKNICNKLNDKEVNFMITLNKNDELLKLFEEYKIKIINKFSYYTNGKKKEKEMIITNY